jgi:hypothetical protein
MLRFTLDLGIRFSWLIGLYYHNVYLHVQIAGSSIHQLNAAPACQQRQILINFLGNLSSYLRQRTTANKPAEVFCIHLELYPCPNFAENCFYIKSIGVEVLTRCTLHSHALLIQQGNDPISTEGMKNKLNNHNTKTLNFVQFIYGLLPNKIYWFVNQ